MSDTPRTDDQAWTPRWDGMGAEPTPVVDADFARTLERENAKLREAVFQKVKDYFDPPFRYIQDGQFIVDSVGTRVLDVRGWGHFSGLGSHGLPVEEAESIQDQLGEHVAQLLNLHWPK